METEEKKSKRKKRRLTNISIPRRLAEDILRFIDEHPELHLKRSVSAFVKEAARHRLIKLKQRPLTLEDES